jgi:solute:Na+ symporter, SSS family
VITRYDYVIIAFYFLFILGIGLLFRRLSRNTSDYFRCGGAMPWWITGTSAWIAQFSAWTFTGAAAETYDAGFLVLCLYYSNVIGVALLFAYLSVRYRRMRVVTWMEGVRARYGPFTEKFYTVLKIPLVLLTSGVTLNAVGVFMTAVFHFNTNEILIALGSVVTLVSFAGGAWAVLASDFVQMLLVVSISVLVAFLSLRQPHVGGIVHLLHSLPPAHYHWTMLEREPVLLMYIAVLLWFGLSSQNNMEYSTMFLMAKSDRDARRMTVIPLLGSLVGPLIFLLPPLVATITHPNLAAEYPSLRQPHEAAFVAVCLDVLPSGLIGVLISAMLGATLTNMDAAVNKGVGVFVRSFYKPIFDRDCPEKKLLKIGKFCTLCFGAIIIYIAVLVNNFRTLSLFDLTNAIAGLLLGPLMIPLILAFFIRRTPGWSAWTSALVGLAISAAATHWVDPDAIARWLGWTMLTIHEAHDLKFAITTFSIIIVETIWFCFTGRFYEQSPAEHKARVEIFFNNLRTPLDPIKEGVANYDQVIYRLVGGLCAVYGGFVLLLMLIPNSPGGRMCIAFCGGVIGMMGGILLWRSRLATPLAGRSVRETEHEHVLD